MIVNKKWIIFVMIIVLVIMTWYGIKANNSEISNENRENEMGTCNMLTKQDVANAYINATNKEFWMNIDGGYTDTKEELMNQTLGEDMSEKIMVYCSTENNIAGKSDIHNYYFLYCVTDDERVLYHVDRISYYCEFKCFQSRYSSCWAGDSKEKMEKDLKFQGAKFLYEITIEWPSVFVPKIKKTKKKNEFINGMEKKLKCLTKAIYGKGEYKVYIWDFEDADIRTQILILNCKENVMAEYPVEFYNEDGKVDIHIPSGVHVDIKQTVDYSIGDVRYCELFEMFSVIKFNFLL